MTVLCFCVSGGEGADSPWAELVHAAPHAGLLGARWPGPAARPGETLRDDPEEEEDAPAQQKEEMRWNNAAMLGIEVTFWTTTCLRTFSTDVCDTFGTSVGETRGEACQTSWAVFNQTVALKCVPNVNTFLHALDIWTDLLPLGLFLLLSLLLISHPQRSTAESHRAPEGKTEGKPVQYMLNTHWCTHSTIEGYFVQLLVQTVVPTEMWPKHSSCSFHQVSLSHFSLNHYVAWCTPKYLLGNIKTTLL